MITVGYWDQTYAEKRTILAEENRKRVKYLPIKREADDIVLKCMGMFPIKEKPLLMNREKWYYHPFFEPKCDVIHNFNGVCNTKLPWFSTYETMLPRILQMDIGKPIGRNWLKHNCELIARDNCKGLFPLSGSAYEIEKAYLKEHAKEYYQDILRKTRVIHPPQRELVTEEMISEKSRNVHERIEFIFIGTGFWVKGGKEAVEALAQFKKDYNFGLTIISNFLSVPHTEPGYTKEDYRQGMKVIQENKDWITVHNKLSNRQVLKLCAKSHVGLFPSYGDTYGYVCLEMQASGMPVITSDIRAFPEINNQDCGYMFHIDPTMSGREKQESNRQHLTKILEEIFDNPDQIERKGIRSLHRIREEHSPQAYADFMFEQYQKALR